MEATASRLEWPKIGPGLPEWSHTSLAPQNRHGAMSDTRTMEAVKRFNNSQTHFGSFCVKICLHVFVFQKLLVTRVSLLGAPGRTTSRALLLSEANFLWEPRGFYDSVRGGGYDDAGDDRN